MIPEEIEDYFLELFDMNAENKDYPNHHISMEYDRCPFVRAQIMTKPKREIVCEFNDDSIVEIYSESAVPKVRTITTKVIEHPSIMTTHNVNCDKMVIKHSQIRGHVRHSIKISKKIKKIIETSIKRLKLYYEISDYKYDSNAHDVVYSFSIVNKQEFQEFQDSIEVAKKNNDIIRISNRVSGMDNYFQQNYDGNRHLY